MPIATLPLPRFGRRQRLSEREREALSTVAIVAVLLALLVLLVPPRHPHSHGGTSKVDVAHLTIKKYAFEAYPQWLTYNGGCPTTLLALHEYTSNKDPRDPWGSDYQMLCGVPLPEGARGIAVWSRGEDGLDDTADDIRSWE